MRVLLAYAEKASDSRKQAIAALESKHWSAGLYTNVNAGNNSNKTWALLAARKHLQFMFSLVSKRALHLHQEAQL